MNNRTTATDQTASKAGGLLPKAKGPAGRVSDSSVFKMSLTPENVRRRIRTDIVTLIGLRKGPKGTFTPLEEQLVLAMETIMRKGQGPALLITHKELFGAFLSLKKYYNTDQVTVDSEDGPTTVVLFDALFECAKEDAFCDQRIRELRAEQRALGSVLRQASYQKRLQTLKNQNYTYLKRFRQLVIQDAARRRETGKIRNILVYDKALTLDGLVDYYRKGGNYNQSQDPRRSDTGNVSLRVDRESANGAPLAHRQMKSPGRKQNRDVADWQTFRENLKDGLPSDATG